MRFIGSNSALVLWKNPWAVSISHSLEFRQSFSSYSIHRIKKETSADLNSLQHIISWFYPKIYCFQNINIKLNLITWITLKSSVVIFRALEPLQPHWPHLPWQPYWPKQLLQLYIIKEFLGPNCWIIPGTKMTNTGPFLWNGSSKIQFFTDI